MTKEEKIKEAWDSLPEKVLNKVIINDGWLYYGYACNGWDDVEEYLESFNCDVNRDNYEMSYHQCDNGDLINVHVRPKYLKGLENNNGWQKTEEGLPKVSGMYICYHKRGYQSQRYFNAELEEFYEYDSETLNQSDVTHYRPVEIIPDPLY